jgi:hypothetical protein
MRFNGASRAFCQIAFANWLNSSFELANNKAVVARASGRNFPAAFDLKVGVGGAYSER